MDYGHSGESIKGKRAEREAIAFIDQLVVDVGGLKNHLRKLQQKCEVGSALRLEVSHLFQESRGPWLPFKRFG